MYLIRLRLQNWEEGFELNKMRAGYKRAYVEMVLKMDGPLQLDTAMSFV